MAKLSLSLGIGIAFEQEIVDGQPGPPHAEVKINGPKHIPVRVYQDFQERVLRAFLDVFTNIDSIEVKSVRDLSRLVDPDKGN